MTDRRFLPLADLEAFVKKCDKLRAEGLSDSTIAQRLKVGRTTIVDRRRRWKEYLDEMAEEELAQDLGEYR